MTTDVNVATPSDVAVEGDVTPEEASAPVTPSKASQPGDKTDKALLLESLQKERDKRRELETKLQEAEEKLSLTTGSSEGDFVTKAEIAEIKKRLAKSELLEAQPILKDHWNAFEEFRDLEENKGMNLRTAAKAFIIEKELNVPRRKGLEPATGGQKTPAKLGMTAEEADDLRKNDYRRWLHLVREGKLNVVE